MSELGYLGAFAGGVLALLSPCSALLLPSFFAYAFQRPGRLLARTLVFYVGLAVVLVPLGMGSPAVARIFFGHRDTLITVAGWLIIALGVLQIAGGGFALGPARRLLGAVSGRSSASVFALGAVYGLAGFCSGPILGSILTVAAATGDPARGGALLAVYALGMAAPLLALALVWDRWELGSRGWLHGREIALGPLRVNTISLTSGLLFVVIGVLFLVYDGTAGLLGARGLTDLDATAQEWIARTVAHVPDVVPLALVAAVAVVLIVRQARTSAPRS